jgi:hypothetical protein
MEPEVSFLRSAFTRAPREIAYLSTAGGVQSTTSHSVTFRSILILCCHLHVSLLCRFSDRTSACSYLFFPVPAACSPISSSWLLNFNHCLRSFMLFAKSESLNFTNHQHAMATSAWTPNGKVIVPVSLRMLVLATVCPRTLVFGRRRTRWNRPAKLLIPVVAQKVVGDRCVVMWGSTADIPRRTGSLSEGPEMWLDRAG